MGESENITSESEEKYHEFFRTIPNKSIHYSYKIAVSIAAAIYTATAQNNKQNGSHPKTTTNFVRLYFSYMIVLETADLI